MAGLFGRSSKKKRMQYDPPGSRSRKKANQKANRRFDDIFITRRALMFKTAIASGFAVLTARMAYMQIGRGTNYQEAAESNIVDWTPLKPARGLIYDREARVLASNRKSWSVSVIPVDVLNLEEADLSYVREQLITALRLPDVVIVKPGSIPKDAKDQVYRRLGMLLGDESEEDLASTKSWIERQLRVNYVALFEGISAEQAAQINSYKNDLPGIEVVSYFDYVMTNFRYQSQPMLLKSDVSRDVAMKLASNQLYLPGIVLNDDSLARVYSGGPTMSHILGFAGPITQEELRVDSNVLSKDENGIIQYKYYQPGDTIGKQGLEAYYEEQLRGSKGGYLYERDGSGREIRRLTEGSTQAVPGRNLRLTVNLELQAAVSSMLDKELPQAMQRRYDADAKAGVAWRDHVTQGGAVVVIDVKRGEVLAMASSPTYDNQLFVDGISERKYRELAQDSRGPLYDKCFMQKYMPGSVIKPFMAMTGLREKTIDANKQYSCAGAIVVPFDFDESQGNTYKCWQTAGHGAMNVESAIEQSCDVFFYNVGVSSGQRKADGTFNHYVDYTPTKDVVGQSHNFEGLGIDKIHTNLTKRFWFGKETLIDLPLETAGTIPNDAYKRSITEKKEGWSIGDTVNASIGQGYIEMTPLQIAMNTAALCNGGKVLRPRIVQAVVDDEGNVLQEFEPIVNRRVKFDADELSLVLNGMRKVVHDPVGTANSSNGVTKWPFTNPPNDDKQKEILIGAKTGTAEFWKPDKNLPDGGFYDTHAWLSLFSPWDDPEVAVCVFIESGGEGSTNAVPVADKALRAYYEMTGARPRGMMLRQDKAIVSDAVTSPLDDPNAGKVDKKKKTPTPESTPEGA
jgi:penicillin-binding protein 2